jgi:hypothetical protein
VIEVRSPAGERIFPLSSCVLTGSEAHPASCTMGTGVLSPVVKRGRGVTLSIHPRLVPRSRGVGAILPLPPPQAPPWRVAGPLYFTLPIKSVCRAKLINVKPAELVKNVIYVSAVCRRLTQATDIETRYSLQRVMRFNRS